MRYDDTREGPPARPAATARLPFWFCLTKPRRSKYGRDVSRFALLSRFGSERRSEVTTSWIAISTHESACRVACSLHTQTRPLCERGFDLHNVKCVKRHKDSNCPLSFTKLIFTSLCCNVVIPFHSKSIPSSKLREGETLDASRHFSRNLHAKPLNIWVFLPSSIQRGKKCPCLAPA